MLVMRVTEERLRDAAGVMARAFLNDPIERWALGGTAQDCEDVEALEGRMTRYFTLVNQLVVARGMMWETEDGCGACVWISPEAASDYAEHDVAIRPRLAALTFDEASRYESMWDWIDGRIPTEPLWVLDLIGVEPKAQGRGIGSALIEHGLAMARAAGQPAFLLAGDPRNVAYYEGFGFRTVEDADAPFGGPHIWFMRREP